MKVLTSKVDDSINFVTPSKDGGFFESRYVRRVPEYLICYLSSHSGCNKGCRMCHLTATEQTMMESASLPDYALQTSYVLKHYDNCETAQYIHYNWMARGEALANPVVLSNWSNLSIYLSKAAKERNLIPKFNISTIMPLTYKDDLDHTFQGINPTIYYSLYSMNENFRKKWLPGAMPAEDALDKLKEYQESTKKIIKLHWAFIEGENDDYDDLKAIAKAVNDRNLVVDYNIVRYNPYDESYGKESPDVEALAAFLRFLTRRPVQVVKRVGIDVKASCGMFVR